MTRKFRLVRKGENGMVSPWMTNNFDLIKTLLPLNIDGSSPYDFRNFLTFNNPQGMDLSKLLNLGDLSVNTEMSAPKPLNTGRISKGMDLSKLLGLNNVGVNTKVSTISPQNTGVISEGLDPEKQRAIGSGISSLLGTGVSAVKAFKPVETTLAYDTGMGIANSVVDTAAKIPGLQGYAMAAKGTLQVLDLSNNLISTHVDELQEDKDVRARQNAGFGGLYATVDEAKAASGKDYGWLSGGGKEAQQKHDESVDLLAGVAQVDKQAQDDFAAANDPTALLRRKAKSQGGITPLRPGAKEGMKFEYRDFSEVVEFQKGGSFNIIPEGALHARKHNIDIDNITKKGIPVVSEDEEGKVTQQAEIEQNEIILRLEVTEKLEELMKKYNNDSYTQSEKDLFAIEAGKLLTTEILHNTDDRTNLIEQVKNE